MKKSIYTVASVAFITATMFTSCDTPKDEVINAQENVVEANSKLETATDNYKADIEKYRAQTNEKIAANDKIIADLKAGVGNKDATTKAEYWKKIAELEKKNNELSARIYNYKADGKENWETFKTEFNHDMEGLGDAFKDLTVKNTK